MTATAGETIVGGTALDEPVQVRFTTAGIPMAVRWRERIWQVAAEPKHWFGRWDWWNHVKRAVPGQGPIIEVEYWMVQVRLAGSTLRTLLLRRDSGSAQWRVVQVCDDQ
jgi:hypothetical protein